MVYTQAWHKSKACNKYTSEYKEKRKTHYTCVQRLSRAIQSGVENHLVLITSRTKDQLPSSTYSPTASPYLHTRRWKRPSLGSQRVSKHILWNPILGHTGMRCTQLVMWVSMMQMLVTMKRFSNTLRTMPQRSNPRGKTSATTSKKAKVPRGRRRSEDHVWFEDRWMVASLCDEWLTMLCGLILG
jgi:hypothetical protein